MDHAVSVANEPQLSRNGGLIVHQVPVWKDNLAWILVCRQTGEAAVVDAPDAQPVLDYAKSRNINITAIFNTHHHPDHIGINRALGENLANYRVVGYRHRAADIPGISEKVEDGDWVTLGAATGQVFLTEGHVDGHISYLFDDLLFCGDTMFAGGCGYLFDGPPEKMHASLQRLAALEGTTQVMCAHEYTEDNLRFAFSLEPDNGDLIERIAEMRKTREVGASTVPTTIALERATNPFLRGHCEWIQETLAAKMPEVPLDTPAQIFGAMRALKDSKAYKSLTDSEFYGG